MTIEIPLTRGLVALVDDADALAVQALGRWCASVKPNGNRYALRGARRADGRGTTLLMHRFLTDWPLVDHINGDGLDNRRENLRPASKSQNAMNYGLPRDNTSGYRGVTWHKPCRKWIAQVWKDQQRIYLGLFDDPRAAALAYDEAALTLHGSFARPNFPLKESA